jgi:hypothetical protein
MFVEKWQRSKPYDPIRDRIIPRLRLVLQTLDASGIKNVSGSKSRSVFFGAGGLEPSDQ